MELIEVLLVLGVFLPLLLVGVWQLNRLNPNKKANKAGDSSIKELYSVYNTQVSDVLKLKDKSIASLQAKLRNFEEPDEQEEPGTEKMVTFEEISALVTKIYPKYAPMLPLMKKQIMEITKGMTLEQVMEYVKQLTGNKQPQAGLSPESAQYNPDWA